MMEGPFLMKGALFFFSAPYTSRRLHILKAEGMSVCIAAESVISAKKK